MYAILVNLQMSRNDEFEKAMSSEDTYTEQTDCGGHLHSATTSFRIAGNHGDYLRHLCDHCLLKDDPPASVGPEKSSVVENNCLYSEHTQ